MKRSQILSLVLFVIIPVSGTSLFADLVLPEDLPHVAPRYDSTRNMEISRGNSSISICSFNIKFLGSSLKRDNKGLINIIKGFDIVVIQELTAPPYTGIYPDGTPFKPDPEAAVFFDEMEAQGFQYVLSPEETGGGKRLHINTTATEWWVTFYKPNKIQPANDLPQGFLSENRLNHPDFERVPFAFPFRSRSGGVDFVLVSVHLEPAPGSVGTSRRRHEIAAIADWIGSRRPREHDYIILGDTNIQNQGELNASIPQGWNSLNSSCIPTNTSPNSPKPFDQVFYNPQYTSKELRFPRFQVYNLVELMRTAWTRFSSLPYPGDPYDRYKFQDAYSDHNPVSFVVTNDGQDDD